jgi:4-hydroxybenzoate polyprenyltransferase
MKLIAAFFKLVRWPNLVFILLTQVLFLYAVVIPLSGMDTRTMLGDWGLWLIIVSSVLIAASGYIINDYFDINIDLINKPRKLIVDKIINRRWAMFFHIAFSGMGVLMGFYYDWIHHCFWLGASNLVCVVLLFGYSIRLKKTLLTGNILISLFTAWVIGVIFIHCYFMINLAGLPPNGNTFIRISFLYMTFSFIISLIREVIKDMEDMDGDLK